MKKTLLTLAVAALSCVCANAVELNFQFDKKFPAGSFINGTVQQENGASVIVNNKRYDVGYFSFTGEKISNAVMKIEVSSEGNPATTLGVILYELGEKSKLKLLKHLTWGRKISTTKYDKFTFNIAPKTIVPGKKYRVYIYRANQKGTLKIKSLNFKTTPAK